MARLLADVAGDVAAGARPAAVPACAGLQAGAALGRLRAGLGAAARAWRWPLLFALLLGAAIEVPHRLAVSHADAGAYFVGMFWAPQDAAQYLSAMRQGAAGPGWLIVDRFTQEPHAPTFMYLFYVALGKLAALVGARPEAAFLATGAAGRVFLVLAIYAFTGLVFEQVGLRRLGLIAIALSSGLAATLGLVKQLTGLDLPLSSRELNDPELSTFLTFFTAPHLMIGLGLLLVAARLYGACWESARRAPRVALLGTVAALGLVNPFPLVPLCAIVAAHALALTLWWRRVDRRGWSGAAAVLVGAAPFLAYSAVAFTLDPFWSATYGRQNQTLTPPPGEVLLALGLVAPLALLGLRHVARPLTPGRAFVLLWIVLAVVLMYVPSGIQRRFGTGLHPMLALVATAGLLATWQAIRRLRPPLTLLRPLATVGLGQLVFGSSAFMYVVATTIALAPATGWRVNEAGPGADRAPYQPAAVRQAAEWLAGVAQPDDVILAATLTGNYLAGIVPGRAYVGHWVATLDFTAKKRQAEWFFSGPLDAERRALLEREGIVYVVVGPAERLLGAAELDDGLLEPVFAADAVTVYRVRSAATAQTAPPPP